MKEAAGLEDLCKVRDPILAYKLAANSKTDQSPPLTNVQSTLPSFSTLKRNNTQVQLLPNSSAHTLWGKHPKIDHTGP